MRHTFAAAAGVISWYPWSRALGERGATSDANGDDSDDGDDGDDGASGVVESKGKLTDSLPISIMQ